MVQTKEERAAVQRQCALNWKNSNKAHYDAYNKEYRASNPKFKENTEKWKNIRKEYRALLGLARNADLIFA